jgi:SAM-dependent methyltransferase
MGRESLELEFGRYSEWMVDALEELDDPLPGACRGTGSPILFRMLAQRLGVEDGDLVLDVGCGLGGPGAWLAREVGCSVVGVDVMETEIRGMGRLFPSVAGVVGTSCALPFRDGHFDGAWSLGALEMIEEKADALREVHRVLKPQARFAVYGFVALEPIDEAPVADHFVTLDEMTELIGAAGFVVAGSESAQGLQRGPKEWADVVLQMRVRLFNEHGGDPILEAEEHERLAFQDLWRRGMIEPWLVELTKES